MITINKDDFSSSQAAAANKLVDFFEGKQLNYVTKALNGDNGAGYGFRWKWAKRGFVPRMRNITKPIVEKSAGNLFVKPPKLTILPATSPTATPVIDARLNELLTIADFSDFGQQLNYLSRLLRSVVVLQEKVIGETTETVDGIYRFTPTNGDLLVLNILHRGNSVVRMNATRTKITELAYLVEGCPSEDEWEYRYLNGEVDEIVKVKGDKEIKRVPSFMDDEGVGIGNIDGIVPAVMHYDTSKPRTGEWNWIPEDLPSFQELVNTHLVDLEFALAKQKGQTLFTDAEFRSGDDGAVEPLTRAGTRENAQQMPINRKPTEGAVASGIGAVVQLKANKDATKAPYVEFKGPDVDLAGQDAVVRQLSIDLASDWSVNLKVGGSGSASSGFQLIVEELDNLALREQRTVSFQATLRKMYAQLQLLYPELMRGELIVEFQGAHLPVNQKENIEVWQAKFAAGVASPIDYLMAEESLSRDEAEKRLTFIKSFATTNQVQQNSSVV